METNFTIKKNTNILFAILILVGIAATVTGFLTDSSRTWSNILVNNYYFITLSVGALLFYSLQYITNSGWSALITRLPLSLGAFLPVGALLMILMYFGL